jgi:tRNA (guanine6-N2)-methyltransferase
MAPTGGRTGERRGKARFPSGQGGRQIRPAQATPRAAAGRRLNLVDAGPAGVLRQPEDVGKALPCADAMGDQCLLVSISMPPPYVTGRKSRHDRVLYGAPPPRGGIGRDDYRVFMSVRRYQRAGRRSVPESTPPRPRDERAWLRLLVHTVPGLEDVVAEEVGERFPEAALVGAWRQFDERTSLLEFRTGGDCCAWRALDTAEDVFLLAARANSLRTDAGGLHELAAATLGSRWLDRSVHQFAECWGRMPRTFRVVARKAGAHGYRRVDAQRAVEGALRTLLPRLRQVDDDADAEFWLTVVGTTALLGLRLSTAAMRGPSYPTVSLPASLKPSIARAIVRLSRPQASDRVLDPFAGAGTLLLERAAAGPASALTGGDRDPDAVATARANADAAGLDIDLQQWDALALPLPDRSFDVVLTNPPFGKRIGIPGGDAYPFYRHVVRELRRVLGPDGRLVLLTSQTTALEHALRGITSGWQIRRRLPVLVRGERATIYLISTRSG